MDGVLWRFGGHVGLGMYGSEGLLSIQRRSGHITYSRASQQDKTKRDKIPFQLQRR